MRPLPSSLPPSLPASRPPVTPSSPACLLQRIGLVTGAGVGGQEILSVRQAELLSNKPAHEPSRAGTAAGTFTELEPHLLTEPFHNIPSETRGGGQSSGMHTAEESACIYYNG